MSRLMVEIKKTLKQNPDFFCIGMNQTTSFSSTALQLHLNPLMKNSMLKKSAFYWYQKSFNFWCIFL
jgi:hypothetical protein